MTETTNADRLADVVYGAIDCVHSLGCSCSRRVTAAVRRHIAAVLDAEEAASQAHKKETPIAGYARIGTVNNLRRALLGTTASPEQPVPDAGAYLSDGITPYINDDNAQPGATKEAS